MPGPVALKTFRDASTQTTPETTTETTSPPRDPAAAVFDNPLLTRKISRRAMRALPSASAMPTSAWHLEKARTTAALGSINQTFRSTVPSYTLLALEALEHGRVTLESLFSEFHLRLARAYLPAAYPAHTGQREVLSAQLINGLLARMVVEARSKEIRRQVKHAVQCFLNAVYDTPPSPRTFAAQAQDSALCRCIELANAILQFTHAFFCYLAEGDHHLGKLDDLAQRFTLNVPSTDSFWYDKLMLNAAQSGAWKSVQLLLEHKRSQAGALACTYLSDFSLAEYPLLAMTQRIRDDSDQETGLLHIAARQGDVGMLDYLHGKLQAARVSIDYEERDERTALFCAVEADQLDAFNCLIKHGASPHACDATQTTLMHIARNPAIALALIEAKVDMNACDQQGRRPLHTQRSPEIVQMLIEAEAKVNATDDEQNRPLHLQTDPAIVRMLINAKAEVNARNNLQRTPLHCVNNADAVDALIAADPRADVNAEDAKGNRPLHVQRHPAVVRALINAGAAVNATNADGETPLHLATHPEAARLLVEADAAVDALDRHRESPLFSACDPGIITLLVAQGADIGIINRSGRSLLDAWLTPQTGPRRLAHLDFIQALHDACDTPERAERFQQLIQRRGEHGETSLHRYLRLYNEQLHATLCEYADLDFRTLDRRIEAVRLFKAWGADLEIRNIQGESAHDHVVRQQVFMSSWLSDFARMPAPLQARCLTNYLPWKARIDTLEELLRPSTPPAPQMAASGKRKRDEIDQP
ncbi:ankyrin repeat domain-containing protein [Imbroritus primus]|uniref:Ankyrin repeat domain-containing protein n=1 Tax=Imbroritus primus TaxID=3058603 RepID=A0ACD3SJZ9_9BURK|nr:ankyrin repeat domain-containing protein [Burkholderiaceae bacterium PBA]